MIEEELRVKLSKYIKTRDYISFRRQDDPELYHCIPLAMGEALLLTLRFFDFQPDGYEIIPLSQISSLRRSNSDAYFGRIVKKEGAMSLVCSAPDITLDSWDSALAFLAQTREVVVVDIGKEDCVEVGVITSSNEAELKMRCFSPTGVWDEEDWCEPCQNITGLQIRNHYTTTFTKYLPPAP